MGTSLGQSPPGLDDSDGEKILLCIELKSTFEDLHLIVLPHEDPRNSLMPLP